MNDETRDRFSRSILFTGGITRRNVLRIGAGGAAGLGVLGPMTRLGALAQSTPMPTPKSGGTLVVGLQSEPSDNIDPAVTPWAVSHNIMMHVYDTLVWQDPADGSFKPGLADSWTATPDGLSYTFKLKTGVTFHDGTTFSADDVKWNFDRIADPATKSGFAANLLGPYSATEVIDPQTVKVTFKSPYAPFLDSASQAFLGMVSPTAVKKYGADYGVKAAVGTGPFMFKEWVRADHLSLVKNPNYNWAGGVFQHNGPAYLDGITFRFIAEDATRSGTLQSGEVQLIELVPTSDLKTLKDSGFQILPGKAPGIPTIVEINTAKAPTDDIAVRKAINLGTDQQSLIDTSYFGAFDPAHGPLAKVSWAYNPAIEGEYAYNVDAANKTLDDAGWALNGTVREKNGQKLSLEYVITSSNQHSELWQSQMLAIGVDVHITTVDNGTWISSSSKGGQNVTDIGWISSDPVILEHLFHSRNIGNGFNWCFLNNPDLDALLDKGTGTVDQAQRKDIYGQAQKIIMDQAAIIPTYDQIGYNGIAANVHGVRTDARGWYRWLYDAFMD